MPEWLKATKLTLNIQKTKYVIFVSVHKLLNCNNSKLSIDGKELEKTPIMKYLGLTLVEHQLIVRS